MKQYLDSVKHIFENGVHKGDRTGTGTQSVFGTQERYDLTKGFPLVTTKFVDFEKIKAELKWFLEGSTDNKYLNELGTKIWDAWALREEDLDKEYTLSLNERIPDTWGDEQRVVEFNLEYDHSDRENAYYELDDEISQHAYLDGLGIPRTRTYREMGRKVGELGPIYGKQWRSWACPDGSTIDQIAEVIRLLKEKPDSRRLLVSAWNPADLPDESISPQDNVLNGKAALPACHTFFQFYTRELTGDEVLAQIEEIDEAYDAWLSDPQDIDGRSTIQHDGWVEPSHFGYTKGGGYRHPDYHRRVLEIASSFGIKTRKLSCQVFIRSNDCFLGKPYNIASYALLTHLVAHVTGMEVDELVYTSGDAHIYSNHREQLKEQLTREPNPLPTLRIDPNLTDIFNFELDQIELLNYFPHGKLVGKVAV